MTAPGWGADCLFCAVQLQIQRLWDIGSHNEILWQSVRPELERLLAVQGNLLAHSTVVRCLASEEVSGTSRQPAVEDAEPEDWEDSPEEGAEPWDC